jgi:hypothetical protein
MKKVFNAAEVMEFGCILDEILTAKYSVQDLFNYANKLGIIQTSFGKMDAKKLSISDIINDFLHVEVLQKIKEISSEEVDRVLKEIFAGV